MKKIRVLVLSLLACAIILFAAPFGEVGTVLWTDTYDSTLGNDNAHDAAVDSMGNVIVVGTVQGAAGHGFNGYAMKYNPAGDTVLWDWEFDAGLVGGSGGANSIDSFYGVCVDSEDNFIIVGQKAVQFGPYPTNQVWHIAKYNSSNTLLWDEEWYVYGWDQARDVCVDANNDIYVFGEDFGDWGATRGRWSIVKYSKNGGAPILGPIYHNLYGNEFAPDRCYGGVVDHEGNIIAVGQIGISGVSGGITNNYDLHVRKYNSAGTLVWDKTYAGAANLIDLATSVDVDSAGDVFVCGYTNMGTDNSTNADYDWLIIKYAKADGTPLYTKKLKSGPGRSEWAYGLNVDFDDNVIVSGIILRPAVGVPNGALVRLSGANLSPINVEWWPNTLHESSYKMDHNYGRIAVAGRMDNGTDMDFHVAYLFQEFNNLRLEKPADGADFTDPPTFKWNPDGGETNSYEIEFAFNPGGPWHSTADKLGITIWGNSWTMPTNIWTNRVSSGATLYWRVIGTDTTVLPATYITSETRSFSKN